MFEELAIFELFVGDFISDCVCIEVESMWMDMFGVVGIFPFHYLVNGAGVSGGCGLHSSNPSSLAWLPIAAFSKVACECSGRSVLCSHSWRRYFGCSWRYGTWLLGNVVSVAATLGDVSVSASASGTLGTLQSVVSDCEVGGGA
jgi:hypothetical protein